MSKVGTQTYSRNFEAHGRSRNLEKAYAELSALPDLSANIRTFLTFLVRVVLNTFHTILIPCPYDASRSTTFHGGIGRSDHLPRLCCIHSRSWK